jgi:hypothetical protein
MRALVAGLALVALAACGGGSSSVQASTSVAGSWNLETYNGKSLPATGTANDNGSVDRVDGGSIAFDTIGNYVLEIKIVSTLGSTVSQQNWNEIGSYSGTATTGVTLKPNDLSGGKGTFKGPTVAVTVSGNTLSFLQEGKPLVFVRK